MLMYQKRSHNGERNFTFQTSELQNRSSRKDDPPRFAETGYGRLHFIVLLPIGLFRYYYYRLLALKIVHIRT